MGCNKLKFKMELKVICYLSSAGPNVSYSNIEDTLISISKNINTDFKFYIQTDNEEHRENINRLVINNKLENLLLNIVVSNESWAKCFNNFFYENKYLCDYILVSHDDLIVRTFDFFNITMDQISGFEDEVGWIGYTSDSYYRILNKIVPQSAREVFCKDRLNFPYVFELHKMNNSFEEKNFSITGNF